LARPPHALQHIGIGIAFAVRGIGSNHTTFFRTLYREVCMDPNKRAFPKSQSLEGRYANFFKVGYNAFEFVIDFGQFYPENDDAELHTRIVTSPVYAKRLLTTLHEAVVKHETQFGKIEDE
jgi:hypothetical protein